MTNSSSPHDEQQDILNTGSGRIEGTIERLFFATRWIAAPLYMGLTAGLLVVAIKFFQLLIKLILTSFNLDFDDVFVGVLDLIDLVLLANLLLIVMFSGYENFVSRLDIRNHTDYPSLIGHVTFGDIKIKLMASIVAMSAIHVLADFIRVDDTTTRALEWSVGIHLAFVVSGVLMAVMDRIMEGSADTTAASTPDAHHAEAKAQTEDHA